jgi:hypothetical protein
MQVVERVNALTRVQVLGSVLGFECFSIASADSPDAPVVAGTTTLRNPSYLLAKLRTPDTIDDCRFLPLITVAVPPNPLVYYHYRQHKFTADSDGALLLYVCVDLQRRQSSFKTLHTFEHKLWRSSDPRVESRAKLIAQRMILPYLSQKMTGAEQAIEVVDLGAGSGLLTARICHLLKETLALKNNTLLFRVWMIDLNPCSPGRFFSGKRFHYTTDWLASIGADYYQWLDSGQCLPKLTGVRIGLIVRFFHNMSTFRVNTLTCADLAHKTGLRIDPITLTKCMPTRCLGSMNADSQALQITNTRIELDSGHSFAQLSLSPYHKGLSCLTQSEMQGLAGAEDQVFLPIREFNQQCLMTNDGQSILARMLKECSLVVIQDMDLRPQDVWQHCERLGLSYLAVLDVGKGLGLKSYYCYLVFHQDDPALATLKGTRIW